MAASAVVVLIVVIWQIGQVYFAEVNVSDRVDRALQERGEADVVVVLPFAPESFHLEFFTECCTIARFEGNSYYLLGASESDVRHIGEQYWVGKVDLWDGAGG